MQELILAHHVTLEIRDGSTMGDRPNDRLSWAVLSLPSLNGKSAYRGDDFPSLMALSIDDSSSFIL